MHLPASSCTAPAYKHHSLGKQAAETGARRLVRPANSFRGLRFPSSSSTPAQAARAPRGPSGRRLPGRRLSIAFRAICDLKKLIERPFQLVRDPRMPGGGTGLGIVAFCRQPAAASPIPMLGSNLPLRAVLASKLASPPSRRMPATTAFPPSRCTYTNSTGDGRHSRPPVPPAPCACSRFVPDFEVALGWLWPPFPPSAVPLPRTGLFSAVKRTYCQDRGIDDTEQPLTPALSPSEGEREKPPQLWV
jgi:hypothetical protein